MHIINTSAHVVTSCHIQTVDSAQQSEGEAIFVLMMKNFAQ